MSKSRIRRAEQASSPARSSWTIRETLFVRLVIETAKYLEMRAVPFGEQNGGQEKVQRGIIRGMALSHTKMWGNGYEPRWTAEIKSIEHRAARLAKEWINDGRPEGDGWWMRRRNDFWQSTVDQGPARK